MKKVDNKQNVVSNTHNISINAGENEFLGQKGNITFSLSECNADLGINFAPTVKFIVGRVVGENSVYLYGVKLSEGDIAFEIFDTENKEFYWAFYKFGMLKIIRQDKGVKLEANFIADYQNTIDDNHNANWFINLCNKIVKRQNISLEKLVFLYKITNKNGSKLFNNLISKLSAEEKSFMVYAITYYVLTHSISDIIKTTSNMKLIPRLSFLKKIFKFLSGKDFEVREKYYDKYCKSMFKANYKKVKEIFTLCDQAVEEEQIFDEFKQTLMQESLANYILENQ